MQEAADMISDMERIFRYSGMVDKVRDASLLLVQTSGEYSERGQCQIAVGLYSSLRTIIAENLRSDIAEEMLRLTPDLDADNARVDEVFLAAEMLSTYAELIYQTPKFVLSEAAQALGMQEFREKIAQGNLEMEKGSDLKDQVATAGLGNYL